MRCVVLAVLVAIAPAAHARTATGYAGGAKTKVKLVEVGGAELEVHAATAFRTMANAARKAGVDLAIRSGYRTHAKQKKLYKKYRAGAGNLAARPGFSVHESGRALDIVLTDKTYAWLVAHANEFGFHRTVAGERWHWEYLGGRERTALELGVATVRVGESYGEGPPCTRDWPFDRATGLGARTSGEEEISE
jgi:hypothetical protein